MSLIDKLPYFITGRRKHTASREEVLRARPLRNPVVTWERNEQGEVVLNIPLQKGRVLKALKWFFPAPDYKQLILDEIGGDMWELCDGNNTIDQIRRHLSLKYKLERREAEASILEYLRQLAKRRLVVALGEPSTAASAPPQQQNAEPNPEFAPKTLKRRKSSKPAR